MIDTIADEFGICPAMAVRMHMTVIGGLDDIERCFDANGLTAALKGDL